MVQVLTGRITEASWERPAAAEHSNEGRCPFGEANL